MIAVRYLADHLSCLILRFRFCRRQAGLFIAEPFQKKIIGIVISSHLYYIELQYLEFSVVIGAAHDFNSIFPI